jgi:hypothetical protein
LLTTSCQSSCGRLSSPCSRPAASALWRPAPHHLRPGVSGRDRVHGPHLDPVAAAARPRTRRWLARDLLAAPHRVGQRRGLRPAPPAGPGSPRPARPARLVAGERGHHERAGQARGTTWAQSSRSWQAWNQAPPGPRRQRAAADRGGDRRQCQRHHQVRGGRGRPSAGPHAGRAAAHPPRRGPRRQRR